MSMLHEGGRRVRGAVRVIIPHSMMALQVNSVDESDDEEDSVNEVEPRLPGDHLVGIAKLTLTRYGRASRGGQN